MSKMMFQSVLEGCEEGTGTTHPYVENAFSHELVLILVFLSSDRVNSVCFDPTGKYITSGSEDKTVKIWNASTGALELTMRGHSEDNPECTCQHKHPKYGFSDYKADPHCPVPRWHRCVPFPCIECLLL